MSENGFYTSSLLKTGGFPVNNGGIAEPIREDAADELILNAKHTAVPLPRQVWNAVLSGAGVMPVTEAIND